MKRFMVVAAAVGLLVAGGVGWSAIPSSDSKVISGCYEKRTGLLRVIDVEAGKACTIYEVALSWNQVGPEGKAGPQGAAGPTGAAGPAGAAGQKGEKGDRGEIGPAGPAGPQGERGMKGDPGDKGDAGVAGTAGAPGPKGDKGDPGTGVTWRGSYDSMLTYASGDLVRHDGGVWLALRSTYVCTVSPSGFVLCRWVAPGTDTTYWQLFAQDGSQGPSGPTGPQGPQGPAGPAGPAGPRVAGGYEWVDGPEVTVGLNQTRSSVAACSSASKKVVGGGYTMSGNMDVLSNRASTHQHWRVEAQNLDVLNAYTLRAFAICVNATHND